MKKIKKYCKDFFRAYVSEFSLAIHDSGIVLFFLFLPLVYPVIYSLIYNPELVKEIPMVVVDHDRTPLSRELVRMLDACDEVWVRGYAPDLPDGRRAMDSHKAFAVLEIPEGFQKKVGNNETSPAVMYCDMSLLLRYRGFLVASTEVMEEMGGRLMTEKIDMVAPLAETIMPDNILPIHNVYLGNIRAGFDTFIMPAVIVLILHQCIVLAVGMAGGAKRESVRLKGYDPVRISRSTFLSMAAQSCFYFTILMVPMMFMFHYVPLIFGFPLCGNLWQEFMLLLPMFIACCGIGFVFQAIVTERESVFVTWVITSLVFLLLSGIIWPRYDMPGFWRALSAICPSTWGVLGFVKMETNGATLSQVIVDYRNLWICAAGWWAAGWWMQKYRVRPAIRLARGLGRAKA